MGIFHGPRGHHTDESRMAQLPDMHKCAIVTSDLALVDLPVDENSGIISWKRG